MQIYAEYCRLHPTEAKVVAVCEPRAWRLAKVADASAVPEAGRYADWKALIAVGKRVADAVAIAVLDGEHAEVVKAFAEQGYAILCEKVRPGSRARERRSTEGVRAAYRYVYR